MCVCVRTYGTIWWLNTLRGLYSRLGGASSDRQDQQGGAETVKYVPQIHGARCQGPRQCEMAVGGMAPDVFSSEMRSARVFCPMMLSFYDGTFIFPLEHAVFL